MAFFIVLACFAIFLISYQIISRRVLPRLVKPDAKRSTPARRYMDGQETLPIPSPILTVFQFQAITPDPIISPIIALQFGWLPALIWVLIGTLSMGWLHSYLVAILSIRSGGAGLPNLFRSLFSKTAYKLILLLLMFLLLPLIGHFTTLSSILVDRTATVPAVIFMYLVSLLAGQLIFRWRFKPLITILACTMLLFAVIYLSAAETFSKTVSLFNAFVGGNGEILFSRPFGGGNLTRQTAFWMFSVLFAISMTGAIPVWKIAVPFSFFTGLTILALMSLAFLGFGVGYSNGALPGSFEIPPLIGLFPGEPGPMWPSLFLLLASGSISGWHALVASQSTSRMAEKETRLLPVSIGAQFGSSLFVILLIVLGAAAGVSSGSLDPVQGYRLVAGPASVVAYALQKVIGFAGLPVFFSGKAGLYLLTFLTLSTLHLAIRYSRQLLTGILGDKIPALRNPYSACLVIAGIVYLSAVLGLWQWLWPLVAGVSLIISGFVLIAIFTWLENQGRRMKWLFGSGIFLSVTGIAGLLYECIYQAAFRHLLLSLDQGPESIAGNLITLLGGLVILASTEKLGREILGKTGLD